MNLFALSGLLTCVISFIFAVFSWVKGKKFFNKIFAVLNLAIAIWGLGAFKFSTTLDQEAVFFWIRVGHVGVILIPVFFIHFILEFLEIKKKKIVFASYMIGGIFFVLNITDWLGLTKVFIINLRYVFNSFYVDSPPGPAYPLFVAFFFFSTVWAHYYGLKYLKISSGLKRMQLRYFLLASALAFTGGGTAFLMVFNIDIYPTLHFTICLYPVIMTYAIFRYRLMDIKVALTRAGIFTFVYILVLGVPFGIGAMAKAPLSRISSNWWLLPMFLLTILASAGPFIYIKLQRRIESRLRAEEFKSQEALRRLSHNMLRFANLDKLLKLIVHQLIKILKIKFALIYLHDAETNQYVLKSFWQLEEHIKPPAEFSEHSPLIKDLYLRRLPIVAEEVKLFVSRGPSAHIKGLLSTLSRLKTNTVIPSFLRNDLLGFLVLSDRRSNSAFSHEDLNLLMVLSNEAALAIENAQFHQKEKSILAERSRRQALADMAPGASHQFNNRLVSIGSSAEIALLKLENIKIDELRNEDVKRSLRDIKNSLELIDKEVYKGKEITSAILKRSKAKVEFQKINVPELIKDTYRLVLISRSHSALKGFREPKFELVILNEIPDIFASEALLQDCFYNLIDNAFDAIDCASKEKITQYQGRVKAILKQESQSLIIQIKDNGIGIRKGSQRKLFVPYFTTKATAYKGSGLGLYVIRDFIEMHHGTITCDSEYGKGAVFTIKLPVKNFK
ncbi:MAG: ATP-binding protein [Candidatus Gorgyraea atricola]|nr:ATP-binding protein [Candidatus Gorgyraea atricola]